MNFDEKLKEVETSEDLKKMKVWMFQEQVRIQAKKDELIELSRELQEERRTLEREKNALRRRIEAENKRFQDNEVFMAKKQQIIENAFQQLALDKKVLECERLNFEFEKRRFKRQKIAASKVAPQPEYISGDGSMFFQGVDNQLALRKRYKDLMKIFHPDNRCGDAKTLLRIQTEYESIRTKYYNV